MTYRILTLNHISPKGLARLPRERYEIGADLSAPDAILVRSADMHGLDDGARGARHRARRRRRQQHPGRAR